MVEDWVSNTPAATETNLQAQRVQVPGTCADPCPHAGNARDGWQEVVKISYWCTSHAVVLRSHLGTPARVSKVLASSHTYTRIRNYHRYSHELYQNRTLTTTPCLSPQTVELAATHVILVHVKK